MKYAFSILAFLILLAACQTNSNSKHNQLLTEIQTLETTLLQNPDAQQNKEVALQLVEKSELFAKNYPKDTLSMDILFKAGEVARGSGNPEKAIELWGAIWRKNKKHPKAPMALFLQGFVCDNELRDVERAAKFYHDFLELYPNHELAEQVGQLLTYVKMDPGELVKKFEKNRE